MERIILWEFSTKADVLHPDFYEQLTIDFSTLPPVEQSFDYDLEISVSILASLNKEKVNSFFLPQSVTRNCRTDMNRFGEVLSAQASTVLQLFRDMGYTISMTTISADRMESSDKVTLRLLRGKDIEYDAKGKRKETVTAICIVPDREGFQNILTAYCKNRITEQIRKQVREEVAEISHPRKAVFVTFNELLHRIFSADGLRTQGTVEAIAESAHFNNKAPV